MTKKGAKHEKKKYNKKVIIMTFVLMTVFSFLTILSKHSKEPVKSETKTHHSSSFQSSKNSSSHKKTTTNSSTATSTDDKTRNSKEKDKDQASSPSQQSSQKQNSNTPPHKEGSQEEPNSFEGDEVGAVQKMVHMSLTAMENVFNIAHSMKSMSGALMLTTVLTSIHNLHQALTQV